MSGLVPDWSCTGPDGGTIGLAPVPDTGMGPGVRVTTTPAGIVIPATGLQAFVAALVDVTTAAARGES
ncbi:hypothetical protein [Streptomyces sp. NRRL S-350]|uniref:hypothetical protein n=1 Tax=Streptomyces sp. NRRL S-350 TaxID=1463902 RepID=UPI0004C1CE25|nr:hypothetical protein [Streptomyces sp. NRRL S-350]